MLLCGLGWPVSATAGVTMLVACWWVTEPISIAATALIPLAAFPLLGLLDSQQAAQSLNRSVALLSR
jgi:sodium-dependent dicarboxylate transporter 2/3/5